MVPNIDKQGFSSCIIYHFIPDFEPLFHFVANCLQYLHILISLQQYYCRFQVTFQRAVPKFVANLTITFPSSEIGRELSNKVRKFISVFELCFLLIICSSLYRAMHCTCLFFVIQFTLGVSRMIS